MNKSTEPQSFPPKKSEKLLSEEKRQLRSFLRRYDTRVDAARAIGIGATVLYNVELKGCGSPVTINLIRCAIQTVHPINAHE